MGNMASQKSTTEAALDEDLDRIAAECTRMLESEELYAICTSKNYAKQYDSAPEKHRVEKMQELVAEGHRLTSEQIQSLEDMSAQCSSSAANEASCGDLNWAYESDANAERILKYLEVYHSILSGNFVTYSS